MYKMSQFSVVYVINHILLHFEHIVHAMSYTDVGLELLIASICSWMLMGMIVPECVSIRL